MKTLYPVDMPGLKVSVLLYCSIVSFSYFFMLSVKAVQPYADDLFWMQIEDFVEIFNRVYIIRDLSFKTQFKLKK